MIRDIEPQDMAQIVTSNEREVQWTSPLDAEQLQELLALAAYQKVIVEENRVAGFLIAMFANSNYNNQNFHWFSERYSDFCYVDRIVINKSAAGKGYGRALYTDLFSCATANACKSVVCEYTSAPLNEPSAAFHAIMGFVEVGTRALGASTKQVSMQLKHL